jgi:DNA polymerase (family 10)
MNQELAAIFYEIADILDMKKVQWKPAAYRKAARALESLGKDVKDVYEKEGVTGLEEIHGIGEALSQKIIEYIETGKVKKLEKLRKTIPKGIVDLMKVQGIGVKKALKLHEKLGIKSVKELEKAAKKHKIAGIETFKEKTEENILQGIEFLKKHKGRTLLGYALPVARDIEIKLRGLKEVKKTVSAGSIRRREETIGDIDILVISKDNKKVVEFFTKMPNVKRVLARGETKAVIITKDNLQVDIRIIKPESFGSALQYFTGNKEHNIHLRRIAIKKRLKLSEYGLFKGKKMIAGRSEEGVYRKLGMAYIEPELRTEKGEIEAALRRKLPKLVSYNEVKGDLHVHTKWSDGDDTIEEMAKAAKSFGLKYIAITDHGSGKGMSRVNEKQLEKQIKEIEKINKKIKGIEILKGIEVDIRADGSLA